MKINRELHKIIWYYYRRILWYFEQKLEFISNVSKDLALVFFAAYVIGALTKNPIDWSQLFWGLASSLFFWIIGIISFR